MKAQREEIEDMHEFKWVESSIEQSLRYAIVLSAKHAPTANFLILSWAHLPSAQNPLMIKMDISDLLQVDDDSFLPSQIKSSPGTTSSHEMSPEPTFR
jgi:hypothetical protein